MLPVSVLAAFVAGLYACVVAVLYGAQESLIFPAPRVDRLGLDIAAARAGAEVVSTASVDGVRLYGWHHRAGGDRAVLYFHGNAEALGGRPLLQDAVVRRGWDWVAFAMRGYPGSEGEPSEAGMALDAEAAFRYVVGVAGVAPRRVVLHGFSLGAGNAARLAVAVDAGALVVESGFASLPEVAAGRVPGVPYRWLLQHPFDSRAIAPQVACPVLVVHGAGDRVVPAGQARGLAAGFPNATYLEVEGRGHAGILPADETAWAAYADLLDRVAPDAGVRVR